MQRDEFASNRTRLNIILVSRLLANQLKNSDNFANISAILSATGSLLTDPKLIIHRFFKFLQRIVYI